MNELINILEEIKPGVDYENEKKLIDNHYLDSLSILSLIAEIEDTFDVVIPTAMIVPAHFNSVEAMMALITKLQEEE